jgi:hypothetical protein
MLSVNTNHAHRSEFSPAAQHLANPVSLAFGPPATLDLVIFVSTVFSGIIGVSEEIFIKSSTVFISYFSWFFVLHPWIIVWLP